MTEFRKMFIKNTALLTLTAIIIRVMGLGFRVFMVSKIGSEGIGIHQLVLTVYMFAATVSTSGITLAVTRIVTDAVATGKGSDTKATVRICLLAGIVISTICAVLMFTFADTIGNSFLQDSRTVISIKVLAPSLPFMSVSACCRGYFFARRDAAKTAVEQLLEQIIEIGVFFILIEPFLEKGIEYACCAVAIGTFLAEVISCIFSYACYRYDIRKFNSQNSKPGNRIYKKLASIFFPVTGSACLRSGLSSVENTLIPSGLRKNGCDFNKSLSDYGIINGMVMPVLTFPFVLLYSVASLIIPEISQANAANRMVSVRSMCAKTCNITLVFAIPVTAVFALLGKQIGLCIYGNTDSGIYISMLAPTVLLMYTDSVTDGILKGLNDQFRYFAYNIIDSIIRVTLTFFLIPAVGIKGIIIVIFVSEILNTSLSIARLFKITGFKVNIKKDIIQPSVATAVAVIITWLCMKKISDTGKITELLLLLLVFCGVYILTFNFQKLIKAVR